MQEKINKYYENYDEEGRLIKDNAHKPEYLTTIRYLDQLLKPNSHVLDACAGAGRYSFYLAGKGHNVTACDLLQHHINIIKTNPKATILADVQVCNALDLFQFEENSFDAVLCMGALYHIRDAKERRKAVSECIRVCKPDGIVALAYVTKIAPIFAELNHDASNLDELVTWLDFAEEDDVFAPTNSHEIEELALSLGLKKLHNIATDGLAYSIKDKINNASDKNFQKYMEYHYSICENPGIINASLHGLWIGKK